jgi:pilus assembly protein Flp/PilA
MLLTAMTYVSHVATKLIRREEGATLVEYGLLIALIALACLTGIGALAGGIDAMFTAVGGKMPAT